MNFWNLLRWIGASVLIVVVVVAWFAADPPSRASGTPHDAQKTEPPPAPTFR